MKKTNKIKLISLAYLEYLKDKLTVSLASKLKSEDIEIQKLAINTCKKLYISELQGSYITLDFYGSGDSGDFQFDYSEKLANLMLSYIDYDWYNNDGGQGTVKLDLYLLDMSIYGESNVTNAIIEIDETFKLFDI